jgi:hypothetical protein
MRHLWSLLAGVVAAPLTWLLIAFGQGQSSQTVEGWLDSGGFDTVDLIEPAAYLAAAGVLLGLLATLRISPLGALLAGVLLAGAYVGMFADPFAVRDRVPDDWKLFGDPIPLRTPLTNGTLLLVGVLLIMAVFSAQRWRTWPTGTPAEAPAPAEAATEPEASGTGTGEVPADGPRPASGDEADEPSPRPAETPPTPPGQATPATSDRTPPVPAAAAAKGGSDSPAVAGPSPWSAPPRTPGASSATE